MDKMYYIYVMRCTIWYQLLFDFFMIVRTHENAYLRFFLPICCFYLFVWVSMVFKRICQISNVKIPIKQVRSVNMQQPNNIWMLLTDFKVSWELQCNVILHCNSNVPLRHETLSFPLQLNAFISSLCFLFVVNCLFKRHWHIHVLVWVVKTELMTLEVLSTVSRIIL